MAKPDDGEKTDCIVTHSRCRTWMASGDQKGIIRVWDSKSNNLLEVWKGHTAEIECLKFSPTEGHLASSCQDVKFPPTEGHLASKLYIWDLDNANRTELEVGVRVRFCYSPNGQMIATGDHCGGSLKIWHVASKKFKPIGNGLQTVPTTAMAWSSSGWLAVGSIGFALQLWKIEYTTIQDDLEGLAVTRQAMFCESDLIVKSLDWSPEEPLQFVVGGDSTSVCVWSVDEDDDNEVRFRLVWGSMPERLCLTDTNLSGTTGLENKMDVLTKLGAVDDF